MRRETLEKGVQRMRTAEHSLRQRYEKRNALFMNRKRTGPPLPFGRAEVISSTELILLFVPSPDFHSLWLLLSSSSAITGIFLMMLN